MNRRRALRSPEQLGLTHNSLLKPEEKADRRIARLKTALSRDFAWKELWQEAKLLLDTTGFKTGRAPPLLDPTVRAGKYIRQRAYRAWRGRSLPEGREWAHMRTKLVIINQFWKQRGSMLVVNKNAARTNQETQGKESTDV